MAGSKSDYYEQAVLNVLGGTTLTAPATMYLALYTTGTLGETSTGSASIATEVTGGAYARASITNNSTNFPAASGTPTLKSNGTAISFNQATADWGTITQWALIDALTNGNIFYYGTFNTSKSIQSGDTAVIPISALSIYED